jgi:hypothetical protein
LADAARSDPEIAFARAAQASRLRADVMPPWTLGRVSVMTFSASLDALDRVDQEVLAPIKEATQECWRVGLETVRVNGDWLGFVPDVADDTSLRPEEPVVVMIHGVIRARYLAHFTRDNARIGAELPTATGYLGGMGLSDTMFTTTSFSCWRSWRESRAFAFGPGYHTAAYQADEAQHRHSTQFFVRFRPLRSEGSFDGHDPLASVLTDAG